MKLFESETAVVTGAGHGIGRAIARALSSEGVPVVYADIDQERVDQAMADSGGDPGRQYGWVGDLAERAQCESLLDFSADKLGPVHLFVHSASPPRHESDHLFAVDDDTWRRMHAVNVDASFFLARQFARQMVRESIAGSMLLLTSLHADSPRNLPHYSSAKGAMQMLVRELAKSLGRYQVRVNALVPGAIAAGGFKADPALTRHIPLGRLGNADDLAPLALAILSNRVSAYVTGTDIVIDGGISLTNWFDPPQFSEYEIAGA